MLTTLACGVLLLAAIVAWQRATIARLTADLHEERAAAAFAHGICEIAAHNYVSCWNAERDGIEVTR
jgi:hypothetical protein